MSHHLSQKKVNLKVSSNDSLNDRIYLQAFQSSIMIFHTRKLRKPN